MSRRPFKPSSLAATLQAASLLAVAGGVIGILINDMIRQRTEVAAVEVLSDVQLQASPLQSIRNPGERPGGHAEE